MVRFKSGNVIGKAIEAIGRLVATNTCVVKADSSIGKSSVEKVLNVLSVKCLVSDRIAKENDGVAVLKPKEGSRRDESLGAKGKDRERDEKEDKETSHD